MLSQHGIVSFLASVLLLTTLFPDVQSRRGGFGRIGGGMGRGGGGWGGGANRGGWGGGGGHANTHRAPYVHNGGHVPSGGHASSGSSAGKVAGAAAAGALGGMMLGHGLSSMARPGFGHGYGYGGYGHGYGHGGYGYPRHDSYGHGRGDLNETDTEYYYGAASRGPTYGCVLLFGVTASLTLGHWLS